MPKISTYTTVTPQGDDKIIVTQTSGTPSDVTKNVTVNGLKTFVNANVSGTVNTIPIFTGTGTLGDSQLSFDGNNSLVVAASTKFRGNWIETTAALGLNGTTGLTGQVATSSGSIAEWVTPPFTANASSATGIESATNTASGINSTAMGTSTTASGYASTAIGQHNVLNSSDTTTIFDLTNTALSIGNGTSSAAKSDAFSVLFNGNTTAAGSVTAESLNIAALNTAPVSATAPGTIGEIKFTADHIYVCVDDNTWRRVAIATF